MLSQIQQLARKGLTTGFLKPIPATSINTTDSAPSIFHYGPLTSNLFFNFRQEWILSFTRNNAGRYHFLWLDSIDQLVNQTPTTTVAWQTKLANSLPQPSFTLKREHSTVNRDADDYLCVRYIEPVDQINLARLADERTRFWKKYFSQRQKLECQSATGTQFDINYRYSSDAEPYRLETIQSNTSDSTLDLSWNINHTLATLLLDSQMRHLHPSLTTHQVGIRTTLKANELSLYLSTLLASKYHLRVSRLLDEDHPEYIPFQVILNDDSLKNGVCSVWNRDTQLTEQVHVKQVARRLADYFKALDDFV